MFQEKNQSSPLSNQQNFPPHQRYESTLADYCYNDLYIAVAVCEHIAS